MGRIRCGKLLSTSRLLKNLREFWSRRMRDLQLISLVIDEKLWIPGRFRLIVYCGGASSGLAAFRADRVFRHRWSSIIRRNVVFRLLRHAPCDKRQDIMEAAPVQRH
jgi:hypothetical protein